ncbi:hypothetical protein [Mangrovihabitans endophyticus]|uniref:Uncharacterized protein n=1 Tax=Mangrovihabitans endophyticus TaxID=1751298 RepID=A0A8J3C9I3_9ACTN|nr:hypothetical protein [Mangrovihabitans endophyticus]GGL20849.1 hypothetical protein GCM10012284_64410 [Mangrovihabitans endophyticus]
MGSPDSSTTDPVFGVLLPLWQVVIGVLVLAAIAVSIRRILMRGPTRMGGAMLLIAGCVVGLAVVSYLVQQF